MNIQMHELRELAEALNPKSEAIKWEYNVQGVRLDLGRETEDCLDRFGAQGWELCGVTGLTADLALLIFKRPKQEVPF